MDAIEKDQAIQTALKTFSRIMSLRDKMNTRVAERVTLLVRTSLIGFGLVMGAFLFMVMVLSTQMSHITKTITTMNEHFTAMNNDMDSMLFAMNKMDKNVATLPVMVKHMDSMYHHVNHMSKNMTVINKDMGVMSEDMTRLATDVSDMKQSFTHLDASVWKMQKNVDHMSTPMRMFNRMNPFQ
jgi:uncharacterized protein YoxC